MGDLSSAKSSANTTPGAGSGGSGGYNAWGGNLANDECHTPNIRSGKNCYPGSPQAPALPLNDKVKVPMPLAKH